jgi:hypothetical protein
VPEPLLKTVLVQLFGEGADSKSVGDGKTSTIGTAEKLIGTVLPAEFELIVVRASV